MPLDPEFEAAIRARGAESAFARWMGYRIVGVEEGACEIAIDLQPHHLNPGGIVHGGVIATLLDSAIGLALRTMIGMSSHVTVQLNVNYLSPAVSGALVGRGRAVHTGKRMGFGEGRIYTDGDRLIANGSATFLVMDPIPTPAGD